MSAGTLQLSAGSSEMRDHISSQRPVLPDVPLAEGDVNSHPAGMGERSGIHSEAF